MQDYIILYAFGNGLFVQLNRLARRKRCPCDAERARNTPGPVKDTATAILAADLYLGIIIILTHTYIFNDLCAAILALCPRGTRQGCARKRDEAALERFAGRTSSYRQLLRR